MRKKALTLDQIAESYFNIEKELEKLGVHLKPVREEIITNRMPFYDPTAEKTIWLHCQVRRWWDTYKQEQECKAWLSDQQDGGGNPYNAGEITAWMSGFWNDGNRTTQKTVRNSSSVITNTMLQNNFPWPGQTPYRVCGRAWCKRPDGTTGEVCTG
ncbi:MAG: hypothetical protein AB1598_08960 [Thermodesulfobacteriota bacterium]